jgi:hypothetical protein
MSGTARRFDGNRSAPPGNRFTSPKTVTSHGPLEQPRNLLATVLTVASNRARMPTAAKEMLVDWTFSCLVLSWQLWQPLF